MVAPFCLNTMLPLSWVIPELLSFLTVTEALLRNGILPLCEVGDVEFTVKVAPDHDDLHCRPPVNPEISISTGLGT